MKWYDAIFLCHRVVAVVVVGRALFFGHTNDTMTLISLPIVIICARSIDVHLHAYPFPQFSLIPRKMPLFCCFSLILSWVGGKPNVAFS